MHVRRDPSISDLVYPAFTTLNPDGEDMTATPQRVSAPDSKLAHEITEFVRDTETELLFNHSSRVYLFGALTGERRGLTFDPELLYAGAMFHDMGLTTT